jgi:hypothetical protein
MRKQPNFLLEAAQQRNKEESPFYLTCERDQPKQQVVHRHTVFLYVQKTYCEKGKKNNQEFQADLAHKIIQHRCFGPQEFAAIPGDRREEQEGANDRAEIEQIISLAENEIYEQVIEKHNHEEMPKNIP